MLKARTSLAAGALVVLVASGAFLWNGRLQAADHRDAPAIQADPTADLADIYAWHDAGTDTLTMVLTYGGDPTNLPIYDAGVVYIVYIDNDGDGLEDITVDVRFGLNNIGEIGIQVLNLPGSGGPLVGPVETILTGPNNTRIYAGLRDDPFFFDGTGFQDTLATGTLMFDNTRDTFAGENIMAIVLECPLSDAQAPGGGNLNIWGATLR